MGTARRPNTRVAQRAAALSQPLSQSLTNADGSVRQLRCYQVVAINRVLRAVLVGETRVLLLMATGSDKTLTAMLRLGNCSPTGGS